MPGSWSFWQLWQYFLMRESLLKRISLNLGSLDLTGRTFSADFNMIESSYPAKGSCGIIILLASRADLDSLAGPTRRNYSLPLYGGGAARRED